MLEVKDRLSTLQKQVKSALSESLDPLLGNYFIPSDYFSNLEKVFASFYLDAFKLLHEKQKIESVNRTLLDLILNAPEDSFLLSAVIDYIERIHLEKVLDISYNFMQFEFWLNQYSGLSDEENELVRAKIVGKRVPRDDYQLYFPIGMGKIYKGIHFISAHISPDLDTTVASFWGWVDAFGARVSEGVHLWNIPGGPPSLQIMRTLSSYFGEALFSHLAESRTLLTLSGIDLVSQKNLVKKRADELTSTIDHGRNQRAVILVDDQGNYLGDWRGSDMEEVRQVVVLLNNCLRWFENNLHVKLISLFAKEDLSYADIPPFISAVFDLCLKDCEPAKDYSEEQKHYLQLYLSKVLGVSKGVESTFGEFGEVMDHLSISEFLYFRSHLESLKAPQLFDESGHLRENRPAIFLSLVRIIKSVDEAIQSIRNYVDRLDIALMIKYQVLGYEPEYVTIWEDAEEIRTKMGSYQYLTVVYPDKEGRLLPMGIISATELHKPILGTVSLRDFCNREEIKMSPYLEVISVLDHHKSSLQTSVSPNVLIGDVQSSNVLLAELAFTINDRYSLGGMHPDAIETELNSLKSEPSSLTSLRLQQRLLKRQEAAIGKQRAFIHPKREFLEYLSFLHAILDDTDLLTKVSMRDLYCTAALINRLKSLLLGREVEIVSFDDLPRDSSFTKLAAKRLLQNEDLFSLYKKNYELREEEVEHNLHLCSEGMPSNIFADTKEQNGCCRVGQTKLFARNFSTYLKYAPKLQAYWLHEAAKISNRSNIDLHLQMISTISGADEVYTDHVNYLHKDELWIWVPAIERAYERLVGYLSAFKQAPELLHNDLQVEFIGPKTNTLEKIFSRHFLDIPKLISDHPSRESPMAILRYKAGSLNSRKAQISPYIPLLAP